ncbi:hypothetical protein EV361DRAFT_898409 [Lentinula raphanica]|nr:hypothetical protein EV361DRAFT_898409 [Lentinula raphanica]
MFHRLFTGFFPRPMCLLLALAYLCSALVVALPLLPRSDAPQPVSLISRAPKRQRNAVRLGYIDWDRSPPQWVALKEDTSKASQVLCIVSAYCLGYNEKTRKVQQVDMSTCPGKNKVTDYFRLFSAVITVRDFDNRKEWFYDSFLKDPGPLQSAYPVTVGTQKDERYIAAMLSVMRIKKAITAYNPRKSLKANLVRLSETKPWSTIRFGWLESSGSFRRVLQKSTLKLDVDEDPNCLCPSILPKCLCFDSTSKTFGEYTPQKYTTWDRLYHPFLKASLDENFINDKWKKPYEFKDDLQKQLLDIDALQNAVDTPIEQFDSQKAIRAQ